MGGGGGVVAKVFVCAEERSCLGREYMVGKSREIGKG